MKNILFLFVFFAFIACSTKDGPGDVITSEFERITTVITRDSWKVASLVKDGENLTQEFSEFIFTFNPDFLLSIEADDFTETGRWLYESLPFDGELLILDINTSPPLDIISDQWHIESVINTQINLIARDNNSNTIKLLTFERM